MSNGTNNTPRIVRGKPPKKTFTDNTYKKAKPYLLRDFARRCAYSQQHTDRSLGEKTMEIDHHNPTVKGHLRNKYENLFLATRHCNGSKSNTWPSKAMRKKGIYLLNPCTETDYGFHIFEHPVTHRLIGVTPAGIFHIICCDLNAEHLIVERRERAKILDSLEEVPITLKPGSDSFPSAQMQLLREQVEKMIPRIAYLPKDAPEYNEELEICKGLIAKRNSAAGVAQVQVT